MKQGEKQPPITTEQKAAAYDKAVEKIKYVMEHGISPVLNKKDLQDIFPQLKESEDEKIRKALIEYFTAYPKDYYCELKKSHILAWLEKQKNRSNLSKDEEYTLARIIEYLEDNDCPSEWKDLLHDVYALPYQKEQKSADVVKPRFKVGDWILYSGDHYEGVRNITKIDENGYYIERNGLPYGIIPFNHEICMRMWTIQDAKPGDVLAAHECLVLFREIDGLNIRCYCTYHFMNNPSFYVDTLQNKDAFHPATKEQHAQLEKAMADAGYTFDFEKKEWKKIERKYAAWSEEDEKILNEIFSVAARASLRKSTLFGKSYDYIKWQDWLKSLKDRVQPQPKQEWSEEDENRFRNLIYLVEHSNEGKGTKEGFVQFINRLKDRYTWKPSDVQMGALLNILPSGNQQLFSLYNDLKKLKG